MELSTFGKVSKLDQRFVRLDALGFCGGVFAVLSQRPAQTGHVSAGTDIIMASQARRAQMKLMYLTLNYRRLVSAEVAPPTNFLRGGRSLRLSGVNIFLQGTSFQIKTCRHT